MLELNVLPLHLRDHRMPFMTPAVFRFSLKTTVFFATWLLAGMLVNAYVQVDILHQHWLLLLVYNVLVNVACYFAANLALAKFEGDQQAATFGLLAAVSLHFILHLFFLLAYYLVAGKFEMIFVLNLLVFYASFLVFELVSLLNILRPLSNEHK